MLVGNICSSECRRSFFSKTHLRRASTFVSQNLSKDQLFRKQESPQEYAHYSKNLQNYKFPTTDPGIFRAQSVEHLHTTFLRSARPQKYESKFLRPHGKPKYRLRTKKENDEFLKALRELQASEGGNLGRPQGQDNIPQAENWDGDSKNELVSPFFAVPDYHILGSAPGDRSRARSEEAQTPLQKNPKTTKLSRESASTTDLERELHYLSHNDPDPVEIHGILKILVHERKIKPTNQHYEALILANVWPEYGTVKNVEKLLSEMEEEQIEINANIMNAVLKVLAIRPSFQLSHRMLTMAERKWIYVSPQTQHHLILAMIRTGQTELAAWTLDVQRDRGKPEKSWNRDIIPDYLVVLLIVEMAKMNDWEGVLRYFYKLRNRRAADRDIPVKFWGWLLEQASKIARRVTEAASQTPEAPSVKQVVRHGADLSTSGNAATAGQTCGSDGTSSPDVNRNTAQDFSQCLPPDIQLQLELLNPANWLAQHLWCHYVTSMSLRPTWSTCLDILHLAANTGTVWLAESAVAVMTYMNGIDGETFQPKAEISENIKALVEKAKQTAAQNQSDQAKTLGVDEAIERQKEEERKVQTTKKAKEQEAWWDELFRKLRNPENDQAKAKARTEDKDDVVRGGDDDDDNNNNNNDGKTQLSSRKAVSPESQTIDTSRETQPVSTPSSKRSEQTTTSPVRERDTSTSTGTDTATAVLFDPSSVPRGTLWPFFPEIDGEHGGAHVDPWDALGPRSSSRRQWTDAQARFKQAEKAEKNMRKKDKKKPR